MHIAKLQGERNLRMIKMGGGVWRERTKTGHHEKDHRSFPLDVGKGVRHGNLKLL